MNRTLKVVVVVGIGGLIILALIMALPYILLYFAFLSEPNPPKPEITYGEFPFTLVYERNGEVITVKDSLICKFDGFKVTSNGKVSEWKC